jgi:hypothetical protein
MAFTSKKATRLIVAAVLSAAAALPAEIRFEARYKKRPGTMTVDEHAISFQGVKKDSWRWSYPDIDELKLGEHSIRVTAGRTYEFRGDIPVTVYELWKDRLDQRFVAELADRAVQPDWRIGVKHRIRRTSADGVLKFARDRIVFASGRPDDSRTWRISDIENISSSGPFELTIVTFEKARFDYGDRKQFNFRLKEALSEARYNDLWLKINRENRRIQIP